MSKRKPSTSLQSDRRKQPRIKTETDAEPEDEVISPQARHHLSEYEKRRLENIKKNNEMLAELNIEVVKQDFAIATTSAVKKARTTNTLKFKKSPKTNLPRRQSMRIRRIAPDGAALPDLPPPPPPVIEHPRLPSGPLKMEPANDIDEAESNAFLVKLNQLSCKVKKTTTKLSAEESKPMSWHQKNLMKLQVKEGHVRKLVPQRTFCILFHPSQTKTIVLASDKWGRIGIWDVCSSGGTDGVYLYEPHSRPINCMVFDPADQSKLYTCSYDGTLRCADFDAPVFHEVCSLDEDDTYFNYFAFGTSSHNTVLAGCGDGTVRLVDARVASKKRNAVEELDLHDAPIKCLDVHPNNSNVFLTTTNKGTVAFWDVRNTKNRKSVLSSVQLGRSVSSAYFSPVSGQHILATCMSNTLTVHEVSEAGIASQQPKCLFRHDNQTGRWLSTFRAVWDPKHDIVFAVGSMKRPRQIDIYSSEFRTGPLINLRHENLNSINSRLSFHPTLNMIAGGNSSGKVYLWTET